MVICIIFYCVLATFNHFWFPPHIAVDTEAIADYLLFVAKPMDYGTIISKLENGGYSPSSSDDPTKGNYGFAPIDAMEEVVLYALKDTCQVHHNCSLYNRKNSSFARAGKVHYKKWRAYFDKHIKDHISGGIVSRLGVFSDQCAAERKLTVRKRHFQKNFQEGRRSTAIAVFDPDTRKIVKQYSSKASARTAAFILQSEGYACEWNLTTSTVKSRMDMAEDPSKPLFGYQWLPTEAIKSGQFKIKPYFRDDQLVSPIPCNIMILKENAASDVRQVRGFESEEAAYHDWLSERATSFIVDQDGGGETLSDFLALYLDGEKSINGIVWKRVESRRDNLTIALPLSPGKAVMEEERSAMLSKKVKSEES
jgi:hypothetical protein